MTVGGALLGLGFVFGTAIEEEKQKESVTAGIVVDMGSYTTGRGTRKYAYWLAVRDRGITVTWDVSDTYYNRVQIGDHVEKGVLPDGGQ